MNVDIKDFIGVFSDVYPKRFCQHLIAEFERHKDLGAGANRQQNENVNRHDKDDYSINLNGNNLIFSPFEKNNGEPRDHTYATVSDMFFRGLQVCYETYSEKYSTLKQNGVHCNNIKLQKTSAGGGYHVWHSEQGGGEYANRGLVYMLYLNTVPAECNGETEFLHQEKRINPVENTMVLWPAAFTHTHRGNPVYGDAIKYVVTGWFHYE